MRRYVFSQGTVRIEDEVYRPLVNKTLSAGRGGVLIMITPLSSADDSNQSESGDEEQEDDVQQHTQ